MMKRLLKFELHKLLRQKSYYICGAVMLFMSLMSILLLNLMNDAFAAEGIMAVSAAEVCLSAISSACFITASGVFVAINACGDFSERTIKNIYARGFSKTKVFFAKLITMLVAITAYFFVVLLFNFVMGCIFFGNDAPDGNYFLPLLGQYALCIGYSSLTFGLSLAMRKLGGVIPITVLAPTVLALILSLIDAFAEFETFTLSKYWLDNFMAELCVLGVESKRIWTIIGCSAGYGFVFCGLGYLVHWKREC